MRSGVDARDRAWTTAMYVVAALVVGHVTTNGYLHWQRFWVGALLLIATAVIMRGLRWLVAPSPVWSGLPLLTAIALAGLLMR